MTCKAAIFDMDGTILDTLEDLADAMNYCLRTFHMQERTVPEVCSFVGNGIHKLVERAVPAGTDDQTIEEVFKTFHAYYKDHCAIKTKPYDGILNVLEVLRQSGIKLAVVSNKADYAVKSLCDDYFPGLFDYSVGDREGQRRKPYPDSVNAVLDFFHISKEEAVYIGDSDVDFETAKNADMDVIMVGWGFRSESFLKSIGAKEVIQKPEDILTVISK